MGDMLYMAPGTGLPVLVHGAFVSDDEVHRVVEWLKEKGEANAAALREARIAGGLTGLRSGPAADEGCGGLRWCEGCTNPCPLCASQKDLMYPYVRE